MTELSDAGLLVLVLLGSSIVGLAIQPLLSERHRGQETTEFVRIVIMMLVTFAALVLGLLTTSVKSSFDRVGNELRSYSVELIRLDHSLREWGTDTEPVRALLRSYTAAVIATTWTDQPKPAGNYYLELLSHAGPPGQLENPVLGDVLTQIERGIRRLLPQNPIQRRLATDCLRKFETLMQTRWRLIENGGSSISTPFYLVLVFWLVLVFASFGLIAPRHLLSYTAIVLGALSIASAILVILELDTPFTGFLVVSSEPMRSALAHLSQ
jgi:hypothetical protein